MRRNLFAVVFVNLMLLACASPQPLRRPSVIAEEPATTLDGIVNRWYANAASNPDCRRTLELPHDPREPAVPVDVFTSRRAPIILVLSNPTEIRRGEGCVWEEHGCIAWNSITTYSFASARVPYGRNNEDLVDLPDEFELWEAGAVGRFYPNLARDFVRPDRTYAVFAYTNDVMRDQRTFVLAICDLSNSATLPNIFGQPTQ